MDHLVSHTRRRHRGALAGLAASLVLLLASTIGCSAIGVGGSADTVTIRFLQNKPEVIGYFNQVIAQFEAENPGIRVVQDNNEDGFVPSLVRNSPPDVVTRGWAYTSGDLARRGVFEDLSGLAEAARINPDIQSLVAEWGLSEPGTIPALPYSLTAAGVIYNEALFEEHGVSVPTTWDEFVTACEIFRAAGVTPIYGTFRESWTVAQGVFDYVAGGLVDVERFYSALYTEGGDFGPHSPVTFSNTFADTLEKMDYVLSASQPNAPARNYVEGNAAFARGEAAMYLQGPWALSELANANPDLRVGTFPLPATNDPADTKVRVNVDLALAIPLGAKHPEEATKFIEFLFREDVISAYNDDNSAFSTLHGAGTPEDARIAGLAPYIDEGRFYQGPSQYLPPAVPVEGNLQVYVLNRNGEALLRNLDDDYRRVAARNANRGTL